MGDTGQNIKITIGVSSCLLGNKVRFDGGHKQDRYITGTLGQFFNFIHVCPEVECGLSVPRESMRLVGNPENPTLLTNKSLTDITDKMKNWAKSRVEELAKEELCGFIFKSKSPSSGMERVKVYDANNIPRAVGVGIFARIFKERFPLIPIEEEGRLHDMGLRENFIESVFVYQRWRQTVDNFSLNTLVKFHTEHKMLLRSHSEKHYRELGRIVAKANNLEPEELRKIYQNNLMAAMRLKPTVRKHVNVLQHIMGYFKKQLSADEKQELKEVIENYRNEYIPLIVPITLLNHYVRKYEDTYLEKQQYLHPHPTELRLRNHA